MRYAILADIHSNLEAFKAVLSDAESKGGFDQIWCLGDIIGYGPDPCACIELLQKYDNICIAGNHDWATIDKADISEFNLPAAQVCLWTYKQLGTGDVDYLSGLPEVISQNDFTLVHGSPRKPLWEYVLSTGVAKSNFAHFDTNYCLVAHSHVPQVYAYDEKKNECLLAEPSDKSSYDFGKRRLIINPGAVGQPRDGDPHASYMICDIDADTINHYRVAYDFSKTQAKMTKHDLPEVLIERLAHGY
jgi:predicted phosphodiesterase